MNKLLCFWALLPIPESQRLIAVHRAPLRSFKVQKQPPHSHTCMHACIHTSMPSSTHPLSHSHTHAHKHTHTLLSSPIPQTIMLASLENICSNGFGSKAISCVLQPPHLQIPTHRKTEGCLCRPGCYFYPHFWGQSQGEGRTQPMKACQWHQWPQTWTCPVTEWHVNAANANRNTHHSTHTDTRLFPLPGQSALQVHEMLMLYVQSIHRGETCQCIDAKTTFHYSTW